MGVLIPLSSVNNCKYRMPHGEEVQILSERHKEILKTRIKTRIKYITNYDIAFVRQNTLQKLAAVSGSKEFINKLASRARLLYNMLFDKDFPKTSTTKKTIAAGLLYFVSPGDFFPDDVPGLGYLDDAYVIREVWEIAFSDIQKYLTAKGLDESQYL